MPAIAYGDIDEDGLYEIYMGVPTINDAADDLLIFEQNDDKTFPDEPTVKYGYERDGSRDFRPSGFVIGDFDGDGVQELATTSRTSGNRELVIISPLVGIDAFTTFTIEFELGQQVLGGGGIYDVDAFDFDGDGAMEIWVNTWDNFSWAIVEATGADAYRLELEINKADDRGDPGSFNSHKLLFHDADGDGRAELLAPMTNGRLYYLDDVDDVSTITGDSFKEVGVYDATGQARGGDIGDIDGDGRFDIVATTGTSEMVQHIEYTGSGSPADSTSYTWSTMLDSTGDDKTERWYPLRIADDLDGDGRNEVVLTNRNASNEGQPLLLVLEATDMGPTGTEDEPLRIAGTVRTAPELPEPVQPLHHHRVRTPGGYARLGPGVRHPRPRGRDAGEQCRAAAGRLQGTVGWTISLGVATDQRHVFLRTRIHGLPGSAKDGARQVGGLWYHTVRKHTGRPLPAWQGPFHISRAPVNMSETGTCIKITS